MGVPTLLTSSRKAGVMLLALLCLPLASRAQLDTAGRGPDELFEYARRLAEDGRYSEARSVAVSVLHRAPAYHDASILIGRTYAWEQQYDSARVVLQQLLHTSPTLADAHVALADVELWSGRTEAALQSAEAGLKLYPRNSELLVRRERAKQLLEEEFTKSSVNRIGLIYAGDFFEHYYEPMHSVELTYERGTALGPLIAQLTAADRFTMQGVQLGTDWYPRISQTVSGFISYAYSSSMLFPTHRLGLECSAKLSDRWEGSFGGRAFVFRESNPVWLATASATLYAGSWYINLRPFLTIRSSQSGWSGMLTTRFYFRGDNDYVFGRFGTGFSADERFIQSNAGFLGKEVFFLRSQFVGMGAQVSVTNALAVRFGLDYSRRELGFISGEYVSLVTATTGVTYRL